MDIEKQIEANLAKYDVKQKKNAAAQEKLNEYAKMNTKNVQTKAPSMAEKAKSAPVMTQEQKDEAMKQATEYYNKNAAKPGSMAAKANMVRDYNERNNKR